MHQLQLLCEELPAANATQDVRSPRQRRAERSLREALAPYLDLPTLRVLAATPGADLHQAIIADSAPPPEVTALMEALKIVLAPPPRTQIKSPLDVAGLLMAEMGHLDQEQLRVVCLDTKSRIKKIHLVYQGSVNTAPVRVGEIFKEPLRVNSTSIILCHNHPSGDVTPSPEDICVTREIVQAGKLLDVEVLDHLIIGAGRWASLRALGLGFSA